jgi:hypothetical protein
VPLLSGGDDDDDDDDGGGDGDTYSRTYRVGKVRV